MNNKWLVLIEQTATGMRIVGVARLNHREQANEWLQADFGNRRIEEVPELT